ncbi:MAG TPA: carbon monoxide dehydrogenase subunit G [Terriglobales bacterium]|nr:carbon monoxide dehydrogenase subunit G [Terriglobales bacterium]
MKLDGSYRIAAARQQVWNTLLNPDVLRRVIPGCEKLDSLGNHRYNATFRAGVGQIKGTFSGEVEISDLDPENAYTLRSRMKAAVGFVEGSGRISLSDSEASAQETLLTYSGDVKIGGLLASIAARLIEAAVKKNMDDMFANLNRELTGSAAPQA